MSHSGWSGEELVQIRPKSHWPWAWLWLLGFLGFARIEATDASGNPQRRTRAQRGLPEDSDLRKLAQMYLTTQRKLWLEIVGEDVLPEPVPDVIDAMAEGFKQRFLSQELSDPGIAPRDGAFELGAAYERYSCDNSNPRSLDDQLYLQLKRAKELSIFIPWCYVMADASVSGTLKNRAGYKLTKRLMARQGSYPVSTLLIDEVGRASRDGLEALRMGNMVKRLGKCMLGVSDGFDSTSSQATMMLYMHAMMQDWYVGQLRQKVHRGMDGAARRLVTTGKPAFGVRLVPLTDKQGTQLVGADNEPLNTYAIDPQAFAHVRRAFEMYALEKRSIREVVQYFNQQRLDNRNNWTTSGIANLLRNRKYIGIVIYNRGHYQVDPETELLQKIENPRDKWIIRRHPDLQKNSLPWKLWKAVQHRLAETRAASPRAGKLFVSKAHLYPKTLVDGLLKCPSCGHLLTLYRSKGMQQQLACPNGKQGSHDCTFRSSKSVPILEKCIVAYLEEQVLTELRIRELVRSANAFLKQEAARPRVDIESTRQALAKARSEVKRIHELILQYQGQNDMAEYLKDEQAAKQTG